jgi:hypothetical protein
VIARPELEVAVALKGTGETICAEAPGVLMVTPAHAELVAANNENVNSGSKLNTLVEIRCGREALRTQAVRYGVMYFIELLSIKIPEIHGLLMAVAEARQQPTIFEGRYRNRSLWDYASRSKIGNMVPSQSMQSETLSSRMRSDQTICERLEKL